MRSSTKLTIACNIGNAILALLILAKLPAPVEPVEQFRAVKYVLVRYEAPRMTQAPLVTCEDIVTKWEGFRSHAYRGKDHRWSVGYGWTAGVKQGDTMTRKRALQLVHQRCDTERQFIRANLSSDLSAQQVESLASMAYNVGRSALAKSTLAKHINSGRTDLAMREFARWSYIGNEWTQGLFNRRAYEAALFAG